ncbi:hypothetical protein F0919_01880 [Taibaiella lutea]|uniref:Uncharacterized protein n=1 Tax=Taibaiella lutea TaxID=2608001 RepID=A0A5M6CPX2_9BACT|nr:hypothetical protein [Taibaiella lutea]KAA5536440.1 hypothetical protein F0919_01880 [Taibaiella lutea]
MDNIQLYIDSGNVLRLQFHDAVHPELVPIKADHWNAIYKIYHHQTLFDHGLFSNNYFICKQRKLLIIEEYNRTILDKDSIKTDDDVIKNLRLFDFKSNKTCRFSKLTGGSFLLQKFVDNNFIFSKQYSGKISEFEIDITSTILVDFGKL